MSALDVIISLPTTLSGDLFGQWIELDDLRRFDSACCASRKRKVVLGLFSSDECICKTTKYIDNIKVVEWLVKRCVKLSHFDVGIKLSSRPMADYFRCLGQSITTLSQGGCGTDIEYAAKHCRNLVYLSYYPSSNDFSLTELLRDNPKLQELRLKSVVNDKVYDSFSGLSLSHLKVLAMHVNHSSQRCLPTILNAAPNLVRLSITNSFDILRTEILQPIAQHCPNLRSLSLTLFSLQDHVLIEFAEHCPMVTNLELHSNRLLSDAGVLGMVQRLKGLRSLSLQGCVKLTDASLQHLSDHCADTLEVLYIDSDDMSQRGIEALQAKCRSLHTVHWPHEISSYASLSTSHTFAGKLRITILSVNSIAVDDSVLSCNKALPRLLVLDMTANEVNVTAAGLIKLCVDCPLLHTLIVDASELKKLRAVAADFPQLTITSDNSVVQYDALSMPI